MLLGEANFNPGPTTVTNNSIPLNTLPFHNCGEPTIPSECNSYGCYKGHCNSKWKFFKKKGSHILLLNINNLLTLIDEIRFIAKYSNACVIEIIKSKLD